MRRAHLVIIGLITFLTNCDISNKENFENSWTQDNYQIQKIVKEQIPELLNNRCSKKDYEVIFENSWTQDNYQIQKIVKEQIPELLNNRCSKIDYEVINIYPNIEEPREDDTLYLINILEEIGYEMTNYGRGNWTGGPRIISFHYKKGNCVCEVSKLYYGSNKVIEKITERINCIEDDK